MPHQQTDNPWKPFHTAPLDEEGSFLVYIPSREEAGRSLEVCHVRKITNGFLRIIGGHFDFDVDKPSHWAPLPPPPPLDPDYIKAREYEERKALRELMHRMAEKNFP